MAAHAIPVSCQTENNSTDQSECESIRENRAAVAETTSALLKTRRRSPMSSGKSKRVAASRWTTALVLAGMLVLGSGLTTMAQSVNSGSPNGLEGTWRAQLTVNDCQTGTVLRTFPALFAFAKGGTFTATTAGQLPSLSTSLLGVWRHMHGNTYSAESETFIFSTAGAWIQTHRLTRIIEVGRSGNTYADIVGVEIFDTHGNLIVTGCGTTVASRME
jgi:hypothetical protein